MAEADDQKTEEPTPKRREEAAARGEVVSSQEVKHWVMLLGGALAIALFAASSALSLASDLALFLRAPHEIPLDAGQLRRLAATIGGDLMRALGPPLGLLLLAALAANLVQHRPVLAPTRLKPDWSKLSPLRGAQRLVSAHSLTEFAKSLIKLAVVGGALFLLVWPQRDRLDSLMSYDPAAALALLRALTLKLFAGAVAVMTVVAVLDYLFQHQQQMKRLRMSKQEVKDEQKQSEGDPLVRARIRQLRIERARRRMMAAVPQATVVIANPTHFAVALLYESGMAAPKCVAKGVDVLALRIRALAEDHRVPVVENPPLARSLYGAVEIDQFIPPEQYQAVAQVIGYVLRLAASSRGAGAGRPKETEHRS